MFSFSWAIANGWVSENPKTNVKKLKENNERDRILNAQEFSRLLRHTPTHLKLVTELAYHTGMRRGEILGLTWDRVDLDRGIIRLHSSATKTSQPRIIPLPPELCDRIRRIPRRVGSPRVFIYKGKPLRDFRTAFEKAKRAAGIEDFRFHDLRHTYVTNARRAGLDHLTIMAITGHKTMSVFKRYNTIEEADVVAASRRLEGYLAEERSDLRAPSTG